VLATHSIAETQAGQDDATDQGEELLVADGAHVSTPSKNARESQNER
jgi:hypothetical protein